MRFTTSLLLVTGLVVGLPAASLAQTTVILDTYNDDTLGSPPGGPEVGSVFYNGGAAPHTIANELGSGLNLKSVDSSTSDGFAVQWIPTSNPVIFEATYLMRIDSPVSAISGADAAVQNVFLQTTGSTTQVQVGWGTSGEVRVNGASVAATWAEGVTKSVRIAVDCSTDLYSVWIDGANQVSNQALGMDCSGFHSFSHSSLILTTVTMSFDELRVSAVVPLFADGFELGNTAAWSGSPPAPGDACTTPINYTGGILIGDLFGNTASGVHDTCGINNSIDEWISYTATCDGTVTVSTCHPGTDLDTVVSVWPQASCQTASEIACNDDAPTAPPACDLNSANRKSMATYTAAAGTTYLFRVSGFNDGLGAYEIDAQCSP